MVRTLPSSPQAPRGGRLPDFLLDRRPQGRYDRPARRARRSTPSCSCSGVKEPKYYLCGDSPPPAYRGPGDAHSNREWIWQRQRYLDLFDGAPATTSRPARARRSTSTTATPAAGSPPTCPRRQAGRGAARPGRPGVLQLDAPVGRRPRAVRRLRRGLRRASRSGSTAAGRRSGTTAGSGMYGRQLADLFEHFPREQVLVLRYRDLVDEPAETLNRVCRFLGRRRGRGRPRSRRATPGPSCTPARAPGCSARWCGPAPRPGQFLPPQAWRTASRPIIGQLHQRGNPARPRLTPEQREALREPFLDDIALLEQVTGESYDDWRSHRDGDTFHTRQSAEGRRLTRGVSARRWSSGRGRRRGARPRSRTACAPSGSGTAAT